VVYHHRGTFLESMGNITAWAMPAKPVYLWTLPLFHCNGWCYPWSVVAMCGTHVCLRAVDPKQIFELIVEHGVTHMCGAPTVLSMLTNAPAEQRRVLYWGVLGALVMRAIFIALGVFLLERFYWVIYPFAALILFAAVRILFGQEKERELVVTACAVCGTWATPLFIALILVEVTDAIFALDSIPAVFAVTQEPFLIYTSNIFAMLGLRSLYIVLGGAVSRLRYLRFGLAFILAFVGVKLLLGEVVEIPVWISLLVILAAVAVSTAVSLLTIPARASPQALKKA